MNVSDPIGDMLPRIRNAQLRKRSSCKTPGSKLRSRVLQVLKDEGYIRGFDVTVEDSGRSEITIELKYYDGAPVIREIKRVSTPGRRVYSPGDTLPRIRDGLGIAIVSTSKGVMSDHAARQANVGGEVICQVF